MMAQDYRVAMTSKQPRCWEISLIPRIWDKLTKEEPDHGIRGRGKLAVQVNVKGMTYHVYCLLYLFLKLHPVISAHHFWHPRAKIAVIMSPRASKNLEDRSIVWRVVE